MRPGAGAIGALILLAGCAATPRDNAQNACNFGFLAGLPTPANVIVAAAACTFGLELIRVDDDEPVRPAPATKGR